MNNSGLKRMRIGATSMVTFLILGLLFWEHYHGGVTTHHILHRDDLPGISNLWGALLLPLLTWILLGKIKVRLENKISLTLQRNMEKGRILWFFLIGLTFGIVLSVSFTYDYKLFLDNVLFILLALSLLIPIYYSEFILGFVLGMTYTFGAIIPTAFILILAIIGFLLFKFIRPLFEKALMAITKGLNIGNPNS
jgi:hypothetical protein